ncbi:hypothetical protein [Bifidobacterium sp. ESL0800]|uniref:hypothetical protein n=1 Tax=Bifidobacterium sp. ESL0800 TaxID=2983236 RepID=UPI0023F8A789|nr:hypothetical protein [Bifidobacterium sp. ESL0800]WEV75479.1 hypothetical protein OZX75_07630 [Bifidobacterium sp. ESL0800]
MICSVVVPAAMASPAYEDVSSDTGASARGGGDLTLADYPDRCTQKEGSSVPEGEKVDCKPMLYQFLGENNKMQGWDHADEIRMDFVVRMPHGMVNPNCVGLGSSGNYRGIGSGNVDCGMQIAFSRNNSATENLKPANYLNTYGGDADEGEDTSNGSDAAEKWAHNQDQFYTIHNVMVSGDYDFLTISLEGNIAYGNDKNKVDKSNTSVGGAKFEPQYVYVVASPGRTPKNDSTIKYSDFSDDKYVTNIANERPAYMYTNGVDGAGDITSVAAAIANLPLRNNGPISYMGWNSGGKLWSGRQANWGMVTDYGFKSQGTGQMVAPANSFFVQWYNKAANQTYTYKDANGKNVTMPRPCSNNTSFYYQWFGLKNGHQWLPVTTLTPDVQKVSGMTLLNDYKSDDSLAKNVAGSGPNLMVPGAGTLSSVAQNADGSIDFGKAKKAQGFDGYFKLVTWPITTTPITTDVNGAQSYEGCIATDAPTGTSSMSVRDAYNPLYNEADSSKPISITASSSQDEINDAIAKGWTIDTAFAKFSLNRPDKPVITDVDSKTDGDYVSPDERTITGTATPGNTVTLYREDPDNPIISTHPDASSTRGVRIGSTTADENGNWEITDTKQYNPARTRYVRYHAWQTDQSPYHISSLFSNIAKGDFVLSYNHNPKITKLTVPHTVRSEDGTTSSLPSGSKVKITGEFDSARGDNTLKIYAVPQPDGPSSDTKRGLARGTRVTQSDRATLHDGEEVSEPDAKWVVCDKGQVDADKPALHVTGTWTCDIDPSMFEDADHTDSSGNTYIWYTLYGVLTDSKATDPGKAKIISQVTDQVIDMWPPDVTIDSIDRTEGVAKGKVTKAKTGETMAGVPVSIEWPDGSTSSAKTDSSGHWQVDIPAGMTPGNLTVNTTDRACIKEHGVNIGNEESASDGGNEGVTATGELKGGPATEALPFTGNRPWWTIAGLVAGLVTFAVVYLLAVRWRAGLAGNNRPRKGAHAL